MKWVLALSVAFVPFLAPAASGQAINEIYVSHAGTDDQEFIELVGLPGTSLSGLMVLVVDGDNGVGTLDRAWDLTGFTISVSGYFVLGDAAVPTVDLVIGSSNTIENGTETFYLVQTANPAAILALVGIDVTTGSATTSLPSMATVVDAVAIVDAGFPASDEVYDGAQAIGPDSTFLPAGIFRSGDHPNPWCTNDFLDFTPGGPTEPQTPGATNATCSIPVPTVFAPSGASEGVMTSVSFQGDLYAGGEFESIGGAAADRIARWDGTSWSAVGGGTGGVDGRFHTYVAALVEHEGKLFAGGSFATVAGQTANNVACWDGTSWSALGPPLDPGFDGAVLSLEVFDNGGGPVLYASGLFERAGGVVVNHVARWNGAAWTAVGSGTDGPVSALVAGTVDGTSEPALYCGGLFEDAGGAAAANVARWDGTTWSALTTTGVRGTDGIVQALEIWGVGGEAALYLGGDFANAGSVAAARVASWSSGTFSSLASGVGNAAFEDVRAFVPYDDGGGEALVVVGHLTRVGPVVLAGPPGSSGLLGSVRSETYVGRWDGSSWTVLGGTLGATVRSASVIDLGGGPELYVMGDFSTADGGSAMRMARYDSGLGVWSRVDPANTGTGPSGPVLTLTTFDDGSGAQVCAGGEFISAGQVVTNRVARWDGSAWSALGTGANGTVLALVAGDLGGGGSDSLYAAGAFTSIGGSTANYVGRWVGTTWTPLGTGANGTVRALAIHDDGFGPALYAAGDLLGAGGQPAGRIARWDGSSWSALTGGGLDARVNALAVYDAGTGAELYAGGEFTSAGVETALNIARWDGSTWSTVGSGLDGEVHALFVHAGHLYAGGRFAFAGPTSVGNLARWDGIAWSDVGATDGPVHALGSGQGGDLYVGGRFTQADGVPAANLARWDGLTWSAVENGVDGRVRALHGSGTEVFVGGPFSRAGSTASSYLVAFPAL